MTRFFFLIFTWFLIIPTGLLAQPDWQYSVNSSNHSILIQAGSVPTIDGSAIVPGDYIGLFYDSPQGLKCGGYLIWQGVNAVVSAWGTEPGLNNGFIAGESFKWKIWRFADGLEVNAVAEYMQSPFTPEAGFFVPNGLSGLVGLTGLSPDPQAPDWIVAVSTVVHQVVIPAASPLLMNNQPISFGDFLGVFYEETGNWICAGYIKWENQGDTLEVFGSPGAGVPGIEPGHPFTWKYWRLSDGFQTFAQVSYDSAFPDSGLFVENGQSSLATFSAFSGPDLAVSDWIGPANSCDSLGNQEFVQVLVSNVGPGPVSGFGLTLSGFFQLFMDTVFVSDTLWPNQNLAISFPNPVDLSIPFSYSFSIVLAFAEDENALNDTLHHTLTHFFPPLVSMAGLGSTYCSSQNTVVALTGSPPGGLFSGTGVIGNHFFPVVPGVQIINYIYTDPSTGCIGSVGQQVEILPVPDIDLGPDTAFCAGDSLLLDPGPFSASFVWNTGASGSNLLVNSPGIFWVSVTFSNGCGEVDSVQVHQDNPPIIEISGSTQACEGQSLTLTASLGFSFYFWSTGDFSNFIVVNQSGNYQVTVTQGQCQETAQVFTTIFPSPPIEIFGPDSACEGEKVVLKAIPSYPNYFWNNFGNIFSDSVQVFSSGTVSVAVLDENGCMGMDTFAVTFFPLPVISWPGVKDYCEGDTAVLIPGQAGSYVWSNGSTQAAILATQPGLYSVTLVNDGCSSHSSIRIDFFSEPEVHFGYDVTLNEVQFQNFGTIGANYYWDFGDGSYSPVFEPFHRFASAGTYFVQLTALGVCGETTQGKWVPVTFSDEPGFLNEILVFPSSDGEQVMVNIVSDGDLEVKMHIIDLQGRCLFSKAENLSRGENLIRFQKPWRGSGIYFLQVFGPESGITRIVPVW